ncbi:hypothetical protein [Rhizobium leguminosarum]|uniref:hypothetical protein n=1 Tax=Rhizobium leguminosarum TaxID=384 RepID=UPI003F9EB0B4
MTKETYGLRDAADLIGIMPSTLAYIVSAGDVLPERGVPTWQQHDGNVWNDLTKFVFTAADIERYKTEMDRRTFAELKIAYADVYQADAGPEPRGLEFGPGWTQILREFCDHLRDFNDTGRTCRLRWGKEKFGALHLFCDYDDSIQRYVEHAKGIAYGRSLGTCQECAAPGRLRYGDMICLTLCDRHSHLAAPLDQEKDGKILDVSAWSRSQRRLPE